MDKLRIEVYRYLKQYQKLFGNELTLKPENNPKFLLTQKKKKYYQSNDLDNFENSINLCLKCNLGKSRTNFVFGVGDFKADLFLVGEAPGEKEDIKGLPFVGRSGKLLDKILAAIKKKRGQGVYITNILKCRPPNNRDPLPSEILKCEPYLIEQINIVKPRLIVALGRVAGKALLKLDTTLKEMRNNIHDYHGIPLKVTYHPSALLRNPQLKKLAWDDFQWIRNYLNK